MNVSERRTLTYARGILEERGWIQGEAQTPDGFCLTGACRTAAGGITKRWNDATKELFPYLPYAYRERWTQETKDGRHRVRWGSALIAWNDMPERTKEEVHTLIDMALAGEAS